MGPCVDTTLGVPENVIGFAADRRKVLLYVHDERKHLLDPGLLPMEAQETLLENLPMASETVRAYDL